MAPFFLEAGTVRAKRRGVIERSKNIGLGKNIGKGF